MGASAADCRRVTEQSCAAATSGLPMNCTSGLTRQPSWPNHRNANPGIHLRITTDRSEAPGQTATPQLERSKLPTPAFGSNVTVRCQFGDARFWSGKRDTRAGGNRVPVKPTGGIVRTRRAPPQLGFCSNTPVRPAGCDRPAYGFKVAQFDCNHSKNLSPELRRP
jgi:hypothetical protein